MIVLKSMSHARGIFTISIDTEMAWGTFDCGGHISFRKAYDQYRPIIQKLLGLFEKYEIQATWAIVGHLFLDRCEKENGIVHPNILRPRYDWYPKDWFSEDPGTNIQKDSIWYGKDIVEMILRCRTSQDIGSHSFSHIVYSDPKSSKEIVQLDLTQCLMLATEKNIKLKSFVFPRNAIAHLDLLERHGFRAYRSHPELKNVRTHHVPLWRRGYILLKDMIPLSPPVHEIVKDTHYSLLNIPASMQFRYMYGLSQFIFPHVRYLKAKQGLKKAVSQKKNFHLWLHPINFAWKSEMLFKEFEKILQYATCLRSQDQLDILSMAEISEKIPSLDTKDTFNPKSIEVHNERTQCFKEEYTYELDNYYESAFKFGRKKITEDFDRCTSPLRTGSLVLDVGCGTGFFLNRLQEKNFKVIGIDLAQEMLKTLKWNYPKSSIQKADGARLPFREDTFDFVISIETLRYFEYSNLLLKEIYRVLKPGGIIFVTAAPLFSTHFYGLYNLFCQKINWSNGVSCYQSFETKASFERALIHSGFLDVNIEGRFYGPYFLLDKIKPSISSFLLQKLETLDQRLCQFKSLSNFSNHLVGIAKKSL